MICRQENQVQKQVVLTLVPYKFGHHIGQFEKVFLSSQPSVRNRRALGGGGVRHSKTGGSFPGLQKLPAESDHPNQISDIGEGKGASERSTKVLSKEDLIR